MTRVSIADLPAHIQRQILDQVEAARPSLDEKKRSKYGAIRDYRCDLCGAPVTKVLGCRDHAKKAVLSFDSRLEASRWDELRRRQALGLIRSLRRQVPFALTVLGAHLGDYRADFVYEARGATIAEDVKGRSRGTKGNDTPLSDWKRRHVRAQYGVSVSVVTSAGA